MSGCPVDISSGWPQPAPAHSAVHFQTLIAAPWSYCPSQELQGEGTLSPPPNTHKSWDPLSFASETSLQPAAAPRGAFLRFSRLLHPSLLTGFPAQCHPLSGTLHRAARALFPKQTQLCCPCLKPCRDAPLPSAPLLGLALTPSSIMLGHSLAEPYPKPSGAPWSPLTPPHICTCHSFSMPAVPCPFSSR